jgi:hypothetical protein
VSHDDDDPEGATAPGDDYPHGELADALAELLVGIWQLKQSKLSATEPAVAAEQTTSGDMRCDP